jgi:uncharacterized cupredoxin-like copper-binding protein
MATLFAVFTSVAAFLLATVAIVAQSSGSSTSGSVAAGSGPIAVTLSEFKIDPAAMTASAGDVKLTITNSGTQVHNIQVAQLNKKSPDIAPGTTATLDLGTVPAGTYQVICAIPGHADAGMKATLTVGGSGSGENASPSGSTDVTPCPTTTTPTAAPNASVPPDKGAGTVPPSATVVNVTAGGTSGPAVFGLVLDKTSVKAGDVTFAVKNAGKIDHEMLVLKTDTAYDKLPVVDSGDPPAPVATCADKVDEAPKAAETGDPNLVPGETRTFTAPGLTPGKYVLVCNLATHYGSGMRAAFTVT